MGNLNHLREEEDEAADDLIATLENALILDQGTGAYDRNTVWRRRAAEQALVYKCGVICVHGDIRVREL